MPVVTHNFQSALAIDLLFQSAQGLIHGFAFFQFNFGQRLFTSSPLTSGFGPFVAILRFRQTVESILMANKVKWEIYSTLFGDPAGLAFRLFVFSVNLAPIPRLRFGFETE